MKKIHEININKNYKVRILAQTRVTCEIHNYFILVKIDISLPSVNKGLIA